MKHKNQQPEEAPMTLTPADLAATDEQKRAKAVSAVCPCRSDWTTFEQYMDRVKRLQKDPSAAVRGAAKHVMEEALQLQSSGLQTNPREATNEMLRTRRAMRWGDEVEEEADKDRINRRHWEEERRRKREPSAVFGPRKPPRR